MWKDPIVEEIRAIRVKIEAECNNDFNKIFAQAIEAQRKLSDKLVSKPAYNLKMDDTTSKPGKKSKPKIDNAILR